MRKRKSFFHKACKWNSMKVLFMIKSIRQALLLSWLWESLRKCIWSGLKECNTVTFSYVLSDAYLEERTSLSHILCTHFSIYLYSIGLCSRYEFWHHYRPLLCSVSINLYTLLSTWGYCKSGVHHKPIHSHWQPLSGRSHWHRNYVGIDDTKELTVILKAVNGV